MSQAVSEMHSVHKVPQQIYTCIEQLLGGGVSAIGWAAYKSCQDTETQVPWEITHAAVRFFGNENASESHELLYKATPISSLVP